MLSRVPDTSFCPPPSCPCSLSCCSVGCFCGQRCIPQAWVGSLLSSCPPRGCLSCPSPIPGSWDHWLPGCVTTGHGLQPAGAGTLRRGQHAGLAVQGGVSRQLPGERAPQQKGQWGAGSTALGGSLCLGAAEGGWGTAGGTRGAGGGGRALALRPPTLRLARQPRECGWQRSRPSCGAEAALAPSQPVALPGSRQPAHRPPVRCRPPALAPRPPAAGQGGVASRAGTPLGKSPFALQRGDVGAWGPSLQCRSPPLRASEMGKAPHACCQHNPVPSAGAILAQPQLPAGTSAKGGPWHLALKTHPSLLACLQEGAMCVPPPCALLWGVLGGCPHPLRGLPVQWGPSTTHWDGRGGGVPVLRVAILRVPGLWGRWAPVWGGLCVLHEGAG